MGFSGETTPRHQSFSLHRCAHKALATQPLSSDTPRRPAQPTGKLKQLLGPQGWPDYVHKLNRSPPSRTGPCFSALYFSLWHTIPEFLVLTLYQTE